MGRSGGSLPAAAIVRVQVAAGISAIGRSNGQSIISADVAQGASHGCVGVGQREARGTVVEHACGPGCNGMARGAGRRGRWESSCDVVGNCAADCRGANENRRMASVAVGRTQRVIVADVAGRAWRRRWRYVSASQREAGGAVIKRRCQKACRRVAIGAVRHSE